jgi:uncharacterized membrane protein
VQPFSLFAWFIASITIYAAQAAAQTMPAVDGTAAPVASLMFFTLGSVLVILVVAFLLFLRKKSNRDATVKVLNPNDPSNK